MSTLELVEKGELPDPVPDADRWDEVYLGDFDLSRPAYAAKAEGWGGDWHVWITEPSLGNALCFDNNDGCCSISAPS